MSSTNIKGAHSTKCATSQFGYTTRMFLFNLVFDLPICIGYMASIMTAFTEAPQKFALCIAIVLYKYLQKNSQSPRIRWEEATSPRSSISAATTRSLAHIHLHSPFFGYKSSACRFFCSCDLSFDLCYEFTSKQCPNIRT